ncbi:hypothetical protein Bca4012_017757 [Brassica carinata]
MKPPKPAPPKIKDPVAWLVHKLKQRSFRLQGFPLTLQLVAFRAIPQLLDFIPDPLDHRTLMDLEDGYLPQHKSINSLDIRRVEFSSNLAVTPVIAIESQEDPGWGEWSNAAKDDCISYMKQLISDRYTFTKAMWPGGVTTEPLLIKPKDHGLRHGKKKLTRVKQSLKPKPLIKKETSSRKQRRISSYFTRSNVNNYTNEQLTAIVLGLQKQMKQMQKLLNKKKRKAHGRQTSFHTVLSRSKKPRTSHQEEQGAPFEQDPLDIDPPTDQGVDAMDRDDHEEPQSPIISQYAAHLHRQLTDNMNTPPDANSNESIHTPTVHVSADTDLITDELNPTDQDVDPLANNTNTVHSSPDHSSEDDKGEPVFITTIRHKPLVSEIRTDEHNLEDEQEDAEVMHCDTVPDSRNPKSHDEDVDAMNIHKEDVHISADQKPDGKEDVDAMDHESQDEQVMSNHSSFHIELTSFQSIFNQLSWYDVDAILFRQP